jgi:hypothetical protein
MATELEDKLYHLYAQTIDIYSLMHCGDSASVLTGRPGFHRRGEVV